MQNKLCFALSLSVICYWTEASPAKLGTLDFDKLDTDLDDLNYEVEEEDLDDFSKLLDEADASDSRKERSKTDVKKNNSANKGLKTNYNTEDLKKFFKAIGVEDKGKYNMGDIYAAIASLAAEAVGAKGTEERKYKKGSKTRGFHKVHHKDEYKKEKEFYQDDETTGNIKKVGGKAIGYKIGAGADFDEGHFYKDHKKGIYGKEGYLGKGFLDKEFSGYNDAEGFYEE